MEITNEGRPLGIVMRFSEGTGELTVGMDHPVVGAFRRGMEEGQLTGKWRYLIVHEIPAVPYTIIGAFVRTPRSRVLFFPAADSVIETVDSPRFKGKPLDHITADPPRTEKSSSHIAVRGLPVEKSRGLNYRSAPPPEHMFPWFSLLIPDLNGFTELPARLEVPFPRPCGDVRKFADRLLADGGFATMPLPSVTADRTSHYIQFDVWLGRGPDWKTLEVRSLDWPYKPEIVEAAPENKQQVKGFRVDIDLGPDIGVAVLGVRPSGHLRSPLILRPTLSR